MLENDPNVPLPEKWIGIISDTHGLLRPEAIHLLTGCAHIIHAGDVGRPEVLEKLARIAPVTAVRGNVDAGDWAERLPLSAGVEWEGFRLHTLHNLADLEMEPPSSRADMIIAGHTHRAESVYRDGVWFFNPGSIGPKRFKLPITLARAWVQDGVLRARLIEIAG